MQRNSMLLKGKIMGRHMMPEGVVVGWCDENPKPNYIVCYVEFSDFQVKEHAANMMAKDVLTRVDSEGFSLILIESMVDWKQDESMIEMIDKCSITSSIQRRSRNAALMWSMQEM